MTDSQASLVSTSKADADFSDAGGPLIDHLLRWRPRLATATVFAGLVALLMFVCWGIQIKYGLGVAGINRPVFWGFYIITFVFWIGISHAGTLISAILRVTGAGWRRPVTRCAEAVTVFALCVGGIFPLIHLGRPWVFFYMIPYPNDRMLWPNFRSPLVWDMVAITTYLTGSLLYLSLPLLPDLALVRDRIASQGGLRHKVFSALSLGWRGTPGQWHGLDQGIKILAVAIIPVAISVHTIVSWDFAMTQVPGWKSTIFGPYFVVGAIYSGIAMLLIAMALLRRGLQLSTVLHDRLFNNLGLLFLAMTLLWGYFTFSEHLTTWYAGDLAEQIVHHRLMQGGSLMVLIAMVVVNVVIPLAVLPFRWGRRPLPLALVSCGVVVGMWLERWIIVVPSLSAPRLTFFEGSYSPTWIEIGILIGSAGLFAFLYLLFMQLLPIVSVWEIREGLIEDEHAQAAEDHSLEVAEPSGVPDASVASVVLATVADLRTLQVSAADADAKIVGLRSSAPLPGVTAAQTHRRPVPVLRFALIGALLGGLGAFLLASRSALAYPLPTGGMEIVAGPPVAIVTYEGTALGLILATVFAVVLAVRRDKDVVVSDELASRLATGEILATVEAESPEQLTMAVGR